MSFVFEKETILPGNDPKSPYYVNVPNRDARPIEHLISYFKYWKYFIKSLIFYLKEISVSKEFSSNINYQLINSVQFPGFKDLPLKYRNCIDKSNGTQLGTPNKELKKNLSSSSLVNLGASSSPGGGAIGVSSSNTPSGGNGNGSGELSSPPAGEKRPGLFKTKSNNSTFMKRSGGNGNGNGNGSGNGSGNSNGVSSHKRNASSNSNLFKNPLNQLNNALPLPLQVHSQSQPSSPPSLLPQVALQNTNDIRIPPEAFPSDSLFNNMAPLLIDHHFCLYLSQLKTHKELSTKLLPRLETLLRNLSLKIKEIKSSLKNESFANDLVAREVSSTGKILTTYINAVERYSAAKPVVKKVSEESAAEEDMAVLDDPFLLKLQVDNQLKNQLVQENYLFASYVNLQNISKDLLTYVLKELNFITERFAKLVNQESIYASQDDVAMTSLLNNLKKMERSSLSYWEHFISNNRNFLNIYRDTPESPRKEIRNLGKLTIPYSSSIHNKCIRSGVIYKKLKILKNYSGNFYVLTCNYLHEFKFENDQHPEEHKQQNPSHLNMLKKKKDKIGGIIDYTDFPLKSYNLNDYELKSKDVKDFKFVLQKVSNPGKKFTFKCKGLNDYTNWYHDLFEVLQFGKDHLARFKLVQDKMQLKEQEMKKQKEIKLQEKQDISEQSNKHNEVPDNQTAPRSVELQTPIPFRSDDVLTKKDMDVSRSPLKLENLPTNNFVNTQPVSGHISNLSHSGPNSGQNSGTHTPTMTTPTSGDVKVERNPFERTFSNNFPSNLSSPTYSPNQILISNATLSPPIISSNSSPQLVGHQNQHESYLQVQKEYLKQQQEILGLKIKQAELEEQSHNTHKSLSPQQEYFILTPSNQFNNNSRVSSAESIASMNPPSQIQQILDSNKNLLDQGNTYNPHHSRSSVDLKSYSQSEFNSENNSNNSLHSNENYNRKSLNNSSSEIPKVFVSSDH